MCGRIFISEYCSARGQKKYTRELQKEKNIDEGYKRSDSAKIKSVRYQNFTGGGVGGLRNKKIIQALEKSVERYL